jgi:hypothetical protein
MRRMNTAGMSLVEIMIACAMLATGLFAGIGAIGNAHFTSQRRANVDTAIAAIQNQIEVLQSQSDDTLQSNFVNSDVFYFPVAGMIPGVNPDAAGTQLTDAGMVRRITRVTGALPRTTLRVSVHWQDQNGPASIEQFFHFTDRR